MLQIPERVNERLRRLIHEACPKWDRFELTGTVILQEPGTKATSDYIIPVERIKNCFGLIEGFCFLEFFRHSPL